MFLDTQPMQIDDCPGGDFDEFRVNAPAEQRSLLKRLQDGSALVNLNASDGTVYTTTIWSLDAARGTLSFAADANDPRLQRLLDADEVTVVSYLDAVRVQFDLGAPVLVHGARTSALQAEWPRVLYRFQRRGSYRVKPLARSTPVARLPNPARPELELALRIVDVSIGGCALALPGHLSSLQPGIEIAGVSIELDADTHFRTKLKLHHITAINPESGTARLGCSMVELPADAERLLQRYIDQTQKRRRTLSLD